MALPVCDHVPSLFQGHPNDKSVFLPFMRYTCAVCTIFNQVNVVRAFTFRKSKFVEGCDVNTTNTSVLEVVCSNLDFAFF
jgi:hypothetical protein